MKVRNVVALFPLALVLSLSSNVLSQEHQHESGTLTEMDIAGINRVIDGWKIITRQEISMR